MAIYYVDLLNGSDSNNGTTEGTPWKRARGMEGASGTAASTTIGANDTLYIRGAMTAASTGTVLWPISTGYTAGCQIKVWPGQSSFTLDANGGYEKVIHVGRRVTLEDAVAVGSKVDIATSCGVWFTGSSIGSILRRVVARNNARFGFYGNNVSAAANLLLENCVAYDNTTLRTDNSGNGRFAAGFNMDGTGGVTFRRCLAYRNGVLSNVAGDADGRGFSIVGGSDNCRLYDCEAWENGDYTGLLSSTYNGSGIEGFASDNVHVIGGHYWGQGAAMEVKNSADNWVVTGTLMRGYSFVVQWGDFGGVASTNLKFFNNTVILERATQFGVCLGLSSGHCDIRNNIFVSAQPNFPAVSLRNSGVDINPATVTLDRNCHYGTTNHIWFQDSTRNQAYSKAAWQAIAAAHSVNSLEADPLLGTGYRLTASSPCKGAGVYIPGAKHFGGQSMSIVAPDIGAMRYFAPRAVTSR